MTAALPEEITPTERNPQLLAPDVIGAPAAAPERRPARSAGRFIARVLRQALLLAAAAIGLLTAAKVWLSDDFHFQLRQALLPPPTRAAAPPPTPLAERMAAPSMRGLPPAQTLAPGSMASAATPSTAPESPNSPPTFERSATAQPASAPIEVHVESPENLLLDAVALTSAGKRIEQLGGDLERARAERDQLRATLGERVTELERENGELGRRLAAASARLEGERRLHAGLVELVSGWRNQLQALPELPGPTAEPVALAAPLAKTRTRAAHAESGGDHRPAAPASEVRREPATERPEPPAVAAADPLAKATAGVDPTPGKTAGAATLIGLADGVAVIALPDGRSLPVKPGAALPNGARLEAIDAHQRLIRTSRGEVSVWNPLR